MSKWHESGLSEASVRLVEGSGVKEGQSRVNTGSWLGALMEVRGAEGLTGKVQAWVQGYRPSDPWWDWGWWCRGGVEPTHGLPYEPVLTLCV